MWKKIGLIALVSAIVFITLGFLFGGVILPILSALIEL